MGVEELPARWQQWTTGDVSYWISEVLRLPQYKETFELNEIDGPTLCELSEEMLEEDLLVGNTIHRKKIIGHIKLLKGAVVRRPRRGPSGVLNEPTSRSQRAAAAGYSGGESSSEASAHISRTQSYSTEKQNVAGKMSHSGSSVPNGSSGYWPYGRATAARASAAAGIRRSRSADTSLLDSAAPFSPRSPGRPSTSSSVRTSTGGGSRVGSRMGCYQGDAISLTFESSFGGLSPSMSRMGSFGSGRPGYGCRHTVVSNPKPDHKEVQGSALYKPTHFDSSDLSVPSSPRAVIGTAHRDTMAVFGLSKGEHSPGSATYKPLVPKDVNYHCPGGTIMVSERWKRRQDSNWPVWLQGF
eukprot:gnl/TRDRNA2_/TRDRNA2_128853_c0_seq1.p1 gnl/TRDRNA2_/TRDRNA2_128853_c0~~gnl/TRDRNA2_/TRDRNA2_128853_c0_seq1.p1  ORF type:complete len:380 (-),score=45.39 gnl/TRDRNA2_/TRDRNA2_128853_c0_seq1:152-1216(-)